MPLTPTDVANKQFRIAFRGYSLDEVDAFLDEVETELTRLLRDNAALKEGSASAAAAPATAPAAAPAPVLAGMEGQEAALRTLLLAQRTADEAIAEARAEAEQTLTAARSEAESTLTAARSEADSTLSAARREAEQTLATAQQKATRVDQEVATRVQAATGDLDVRRRELEQRIEELRAFEREYRSRLKAYLESQLHDLDSGVTPDDSGAGVPAGARSAAVAGKAGARGPAPVAGPGGPGVVPGGAAQPVPVPAPENAAEPGVAPEVAPETAPGNAEDDAPDGPPREADAPSTLRAVPPLARGGGAVGPFTVVRPAEAETDGPAGR